MKDAPLPLLTGAHCAQLPGLRAQSGSFEEVTGYTGASTGHSVTLPFEDVPLADQ